MIEHDYYGDRHRWFIARVVNNRDPLMKGRVQIHIDGIHSELQTDIPISALPWAATLVPTTEGGSSGVGRFTNLQPNALVYGIFLDGETSQLPMVMGSINQIESPTQIQQATNSGTTATTSPSTVYDNSTAVSNQTVAASDQGTVASRRWAAMNFFARDNGTYYTTQQAAGIVGNLEAESNFVPTVVSQFADEQSQGIAQWNPAAGRLQKLQTFARKQNVDWKDFNVQLRFIDHELRGRPLSGSGDDGGGDFAYVYTKLRKTTTHFGGVSNNNSTWIICRYYEIPATPENKIIQRDTYARTAYAQFNQSVSPTTSDTPATSSTGPQ